MTPSLTIAFITSRPEPELHWFTDSLRRQLTAPVTVLVVDSLWNRPMEQLKISTPAMNVICMQPKPTVWQGRHRLTKADWWAKSNAINTAICRCQTDWIAFVDDRCVLESTWMQAVEAAMAGNYAVCGPYQKRHSVTVENGVIRNAGIITGEDNRKAYVLEHYSDPRHGLTNPYKCPGAWWYGCSVALPLAWALAINGADETCDGSSGEDYIFGTMLQNNGYEIRYDLRMGIIEDRTPDKLGPEMIRRDKGVSPKDKSHALLDMLSGQKRAQHQWDLAQMRTAVRHGIPFPVPTKPDKDWWDGQPLSEMEKG